MRFTTLDQWLSWQEQLHPSEIDLGLERVRQVWSRLSQNTFTCPVISVAGTNGKGSSVAFLQASYLAGGYRVGTYTSPHLWRYNERICLDGVPVSDTQLCMAFEAVDQARAKISLTYFEFGTLAALWIFAQQPLDVVILEVGLGGRLDAVNIIDADVALITSISLDHQAWLGDTVDKIAREKAGIMRSGGFAVISDPASPTSLLQAGQDLGARLYVAGREYQTQSANGQWRWQSGETTRAGLPVPALSGRHQIQNAAGVLMAIELLKARLPVSQAAVRAGLLSAELPGRFQITQGEVPVIYDVAHNPAAANALAQTLGEFKPGASLHIVFSALRDKDLAGIIKPFCAIASAWYVAPLAAQRAAPIEQIEASIKDQCPTPHIQRAPHISQSLLLAKANALPGEIILVYGSFYTVAQAGS